MEKNEGYILFHRCIFDNEFLIEEGHKYTPFEIWADMLFMARWQKEPSSFTKRGNRVVVKRGEFAKSAVDLGERWNWSKKSVLKLLSEFEKQGMIEIKKSNVISVIRIVNYEKYQCFFTPQNAPQITPQKNSVEPQKEPYIYKGLSEIQENLAPQITPQNAPQITPQNAPLLKEREINTIQYNTNSDEKKFFDQLKATNTTLCESVCRKFRITIDKYEALVGGFEYLCMTEAKTHTDWKDFCWHFDNWIVSELDKQEKRKSNGDKGRGNKNGSGIFEPSKTADYTSDF